MQIVKKNLEIARTIKNNVQNSNPEVAIYLSRALKEIDPENLNLDELDKISKELKSTNDSAIEQSFKIIDSYLNKNKNQVNKHIKGYLGGLFTVSVIFLLVHILVQSEKLKRDAKLNATFSEWDISYYCNENLEGNPCKTEKKNNINVDWKGENPSPEVPNGSFSAKFDTCLELYETGQDVYFSIGADDGYRIKIDGEVVEESWKVQIFEPKIFSTYLSKGKHKLSIEYYQGGGASRIEFKAGGYKTNLNDVIAKGKSC